MHLKKDESHAYTKKKRKMCYHYIPNNVSQQKGEKTNHASTHAHNAAKKNKGEKDRAMGMRAKSVKQRRFDSGESRSEQLSGK